MNLNTRFAIILLVSGFAESQSEESSDTLVDDERKGVTKRDTKITFYSEENFQGDSTTYEKFLECQVFIDELHWNNRSVSVRTYNTCVSVCRDDRTCLRCYPLLGCADSTDFPDLAVIGYRNGINSFRSCVGPEKAAAKKCKEQQNTTTEVPITPGPTTPGITPGITPVPTTPGITPGPNPSAPTTQRPTPPSVPLIHIEMCL